jgi:hypothetical protein
MRVAQATPFTFKRMRGRHPPLKKGSEAQSTERAAKGALRSNARVVMDDNPGHEYEAWIAPYSCCPGLSNEAGLRSPKEENFQILPRPPFSKEGEDSR